MSSEIKGREDTEKACRRKVVERNCQDDLLGHGELWLQAEWVDRQNSRDRWKETEKLNVQSESHLPLIDLQYHDYSSSPLTQSSVQQEHANQKTASPQRPSMVMLTARERKNQNTLWDTHTHTEIVCHCGNSAEENSSPFPSVKPPSLYLRESKLLYLSISSHCSQICLLEHVRLSYL